jgi:hypothetical protein
VLRLDLNMELIPRLLHLDFSVDTVDVKFETGTDLWWTSVPSPILSARKVSTAYLNLEVEADSAVGCARVVGVDN